MSLDKRRIRPNDIERYTNELIDSMGTTQIYMNELGRNKHEVGLNAGDTRTLHERLGLNSVPVHMSRGNTKPLHCIKSCANVDGWSVSQTFSTAHARKVLIIF